MLCQNGYVSFAIRLHRPPNRYVLDVCGGLISEEETIIPIRNWIPKDMSLAEVAGIVFSCSSSFDLYANYSVYLAAQTLWALFGRDSTMSRPNMSSQYLSPNDDGDVSDVHRWKALFERVEQWYENRPIQMKSIFNVGAGSEKGKPFPTVLYANAAASKLPLDLSATELS